MSQPSNETLRGARKSATNPGDAYGFTIDSIEPDIASIDAGAFYASAAISLKRIADALEARNEIEKFKR